MPTEEDISFLGRKGTLSILRSLGKGTRRFRDIYEEFNNAATLTRRLRELEKRGLVGRSAQIKVGESVVVYYSLTDKGRRILEICERLIGAVGQ